MNQTSPNVFICPDKGFHKIEDKNMTFTTNILKKMDEELRDDKLKVELYKLTLLAYNRYSDKKVILSMLKS